MHGEEFTFRLLSEKLCECNRWFFGIEIVSTFYLARFHLCLWFAKSRFFGENILEEKLTKSLQKFKKLKFILFMQG